MAGTDGRLELIENISSLAGATSDLRETLDAFVKAIASGMETEVCSLYLFDPTQKRLILRATVGLDRDSVGKVSMRTSEGLVGMVIPVTRGEWVAIAGPDSNRLACHRHFKSPAGHLPPARLTARS